ncbi:MAG: hypothetical protein ACK4I0_06240 [Brevundimonas sp.]|uniref:hypothetical protein n=1 Tax=Brevundimonas sp. TaxID=1871086 RepID=UPI00391D8323
MVGLGYVGLPLMMRFSEVGFPVIGLDASGERVDLLSEGRSPIRQSPTAPCRPWSTTMAAASPATIRFWRKPTPSSSACPRP